MRFHNTTGLVRTGTAARILDCSPSYVLALVRTGKLDAQVVDGIHLFDRVAIERYAAARRQPVTRTMDAKHHGGTIVAAINRESREPNVVVTCSDLNAANREHFATEGNIK